MKSQIMILFIVTAISSSVIAMDAWQKQQAENRRWHEQRAREERDRKDREIQQARVQNTPISSHTYMGASPAQQTAAVAHNAHLKK